MLQVQAEAIANCFDTSTSDPKPLSGNFIPEGFNISLEDSATSERQLKGRWFTRTLQMGNVFHCMHVQQKETVINSRRETFSTSLILFFQFSLFQKWSSFPRFSIRQRNPKALFTDINTPCLWISYGNYLPELPWVKNSWSHHSLLYYPERLFQKFSETQKALSSLPPSPRDAFSSDFTP